jgi:hypothetical protein
VGCDEKVSAWVLAPKESAAAAYQRQERPAPGATSEAYLSRLEVCRVSVGLHREGDSL